MKAVRHKPTGRWIGTDENEEYCISDYPTVWVTIETDVEIIDFVVDQFFNDEIEADDLEVKEVVLLTTEELEQRERATAIAFGKWLVRGLLCEPMGVLYGYWKSTRDNTRGKEEKV